MAWKLSSNVRVPCPCFYSVCSKLRIRKQQLDKRRRGELQPTNNGLKSKRWWTKTHNQQAYKQQVTNHIPKHDLWTTNQTYTTNHGLCTNSVNREQKGKIHKPRHTSKFGTKKMANKVTNNSHKPRLIKHVTVFTILWVVWRSEGTS